MALNFGRSFRDEFNKFSTISTTSEFENSVVPFAQFIQQIIANPSDSLRKEVIDWQVHLYNEEKHFLKPHQVEAVRGCLKEIVLSKDKKSGYCFMPTSAGKGHILITLAGCAIGDFNLFKILDDYEPGFVDDAQYLVPIFISLSLEYSKLVAKTKLKRTQVLVHDVEILKQIKEDSDSLLGGNLSPKVEFHSVQALGSEERRKDLKYVIIDECHWGNASPEETIQSELVQEVKDNAGCAFGFTASPYEHPDGKFQRTWSKNKINAHYDFNYYLDNKIVYPVTLREVNLQNARPDFADGGEEVDLKEKHQVVEFIANHIMTTLPENELDGPGICYFNPVIIPDIVELLLNHSKGRILKGRIKVLASDSAEFAEKCRSMFGNDILATEDDISRLKAGEKIFLVSAQKLLVGLNAPLLRYCFISPTNSKIKIMQAIGRLMRPSSKVERKLATLFLTSLSGKKIDLAEGSGADPKKKEPRTTEPTDPNADEDPKTRYSTTSMTLSEAYDLPIKVFYKTEVGFRDFINQSRIGDPNTVEKIKTTHIPKDQLDKFDAVELRDRLNRLRDICRTNYKPVIMVRDSYQCQGKTVLGETGCNRGDGEVRLEIHHLEPFTFNQIFKQLGFEGTIEWHRQKDNLKHLVTLCTDCHDLLHAREEDDEAAG